MSQRPLSLGYDAKAVACVESIARTLRRLRPDRQSELLAILNAIECHVEEGRGDPAVINHLEAALLALAVIIDLDMQARATITQQLEKLRRRLAPNPS